MEEVYKDQIAQLVKKTSDQQIVIILIGVLYVISMMAKHFKTIMDAGPSFQKFWKYVQKKWFVTAIWRKDITEIVSSLRIILHQMKGDMSQMQADIVEMKKEMMYNGGSSIKDAVKRIEAKVETAIDAIEYNKQVREINDKCSDKMIWKLDAKGKCFFVNDAFLINFNLRENQVLGYAYEELISPDDKNEADLKWNKAVNAGVDFRDVQNIKDGFGEYHECTIVGNPIIIKGEIKKFRVSIEFNTN